MKVPHNMTTGDGKKKKQLTSGQIALEILKYVVLIVGAFVMLAPMLWMISTSLTADSVIFSYKLIPERITFQNYTGLDVSEQLR